MNERMMKAYRAATMLAEKDLSQEDRELLERMRDDDVVVVRGSYDRVEEVFKLIGMRHVAIDPREVGRWKFRPEQMVIINCPGNLDRAGITKLRSFVEAGGSLITTDWALKNVIEQAFPGIIEYNGNVTQDEVVRIEIKDGDDPFLAGLFTDRADPLWWLEGSSYPIRILDREKVRVLITSRELGERYGEEPVAVAFNVGEGDVLHMISHYFLQRAETRNARHAAGWKTYASELGADAIAAAAPADLADLSVSEVEAAYSSYRFTRNLVLDKQRRNIERRKKGNQK